MSANAQHTAGRPAPDTYILCHLGDAAYAIPGPGVQYLDLVPAITPVPNAAPFVLGVAIMRAQVVPIVCMRRRLGLPPQPHSIRSRVVVVQHAERRVGLLVDSARDIVRVPAEAVQPLTERAGGPNAALFAGAFPRDGRLALVVHVGAIIDESARPAPDAVAG